MSDPVCFAIDSVPFSLFMGACGASIFWLFIYHWISVWEKTQMDRSKPDSAKPKQVVYRGTMELRCSALACTIQTPSGHCPRLSAWTECRNGRGK